MLLSAGLTPAWQQVLRFDRVQVGEVNRAVDAHWCASGKVLNVARAAAALGLEAKAISPVGGLSGEAIEREFARDGLAARWIRCAETTRCCTTLIEAATGTVTELVENAAALSEATLSEFVAAFREEQERASLVVLTGSLTAGAPHDFYHRLLEGSDLPAILDARGPELLAALEHRPLLVKPNRAELEMTFGRSLPDDKSLHDAMRELVHLGARSVLVTQGLGPVWLATESGLQRFEPVLADRVVNPIGCGDCVAAGIGVAIARGESLPDAIQFGLTAAAANAATLLPARFDH